MRGLLKALLDFRKSRDGWAWANPWVLATLMLVPMSAILAPARVARARTCSRRRSDRYPR